MRNGMDQREMPFYIQQDNAPPQSRSSTQETIDIMISGWGNIQMKNSLLAHLI